jgi:hypothetical protein
MTSGAVIFSVCFALRPSPMRSSPSRTARASVMIELHPRCQAPARKAPSAHKSTATTANSLSICQMVASAAVANGLPRVPCSGSSGRRAAAHRSAGSGYSPMYASNGRRAVSSRSFRSGPSAAEVCRVLAGAASPIQQSRVSSRRLQRWPPTRP